MTAIMIVLGIETSCDETAAAVVSAETGVLSNIVLSQTTEHVKYGGVVPEIAARAHLGYLHGLIEKAMAEAKLDFGDLDGVAATCGPGLIGGLMIGMIAGKSIAVAAGKPFIAVNHLEGHALTPRLTDGLDFPYLLLLISGGHTQILVAEDVGRYRRWGTTLDDACGECFDKSAKLMGLPWPGGPHLEKLAAQCTNTAEAEKRFPLPRPMKGRKELDFSFSGLKTAVRIHAQSLAEDEKPALAWALQSAIADILAERCGRALTRFREEYRPLAPAFVVSGGVAANLTIRSALEAMAVSQSAKLYAPPLNLCSDNAAMIAWAGVERLKRGMTDPLDFKARPRWPLDPDAEPRQGAGVKA